MSTIIVVLAITVYIIIAMITATLRPVHHDINTPKEAFSIVFWPISLMFFVIKTLIFILHEFLSLTLLSFGIYYKFTETYHKISKWGRS